MTKEEKLNEIVKQINDAISILGKVESIKFRTANEVVELKSTASLIGLINNRFDEFKSATLTNKGQNVIISKM